MEMQVQAPAPNQTEQGLKHAFPTYQLSALTTRLLSLLGWIVLSLIFIRNSILDLRNLPNESLFETEMLQQNVSAISMKVAFFNKKSIFLDKFLTSHPHHKATTLFRMVGWLSSNSNSKTGACPTLSALEDLCIGSLHDAPFRTWTKCFPC